MRAIRRIYFYAVALISLELVIWGVIGLLRNVFNVVPGRGSNSVLAGGLALLLVGLPIFLLHWGTAQREAFHDEEDRSSRVRALFLYSALFGVLAPVVQSTLAVVNRLFLDGLGGFRGAALVGGNQSTVDNLIAIAVNLIAFFYLNRILTADWRTAAAAKSSAVMTENLAEVRRLYRYVWVVYGLVLLMAGVINVLVYILTAATGLQLASTSDLGNGLALLLVGIVLWYFTWQRVQKSLDDADESRSLLRLVVLYLITLTGVLTTLASGAALLAVILRALLGESTTLRSFFSEHSGKIATLISFGVLWGYYSGHLNREVESLADEPRRMGLSRLYRYILALIGNLTTFFGVLILVDFLVQVLFGNSVGFSSLRTDLSNGLAAVAVGLPLWILPWRQLQTEAGALNEVGDHARRSLVRKSYLYLFLFLSVVAGMGTAGWLFYKIFTRLLGEEDPNFVLNTAYWVGALLLVLVWLIYHLNALRRDNRLAQHWLGERHAAFSALILQSGSDTFTIELVQALQRSAPRLPIAVHRVEAGAPSETLLDAQVLVMPAALGVQAEEALRLWLSEYHGQRVLVPLPAEGWVWLGAPAREGEQSERNLARDAAQAVRQLAEGQAVHLSPPTTPWSVVGYILGALFGLMLIGLLLGLLISSISR